MFGIDSGELLIIAVVALVVIGPKDLPRVMRTLGNFVGRARGMAKHFRAGFDTMIREAELEEMEKKWKAENERIMREHPAPPPEQVADAWAQPVGEAALPAPEPAPGKSNRPKAPPARGRKTARTAPPLPAPAPGDEPA